MPKSIETRVDKFISLLERPYGNLTWGEKDELVAILKEYKNIGNQHWQCESIKQHLHYINETP